MNKQKYFINPHQDCRRSMINHRMKKHIISVCLLLLHFHLLLSIINAQLCSDTGNFTTNSTYAANRRLLLSSLASNVTANGGYFTTAVGQEGSDRVYGLVLCVTHASPEGCSSCVSSAVEIVTQGCPDQKEALVWTWDPIPADGVPCIVRYANRSFLGTMELDPRVVRRNPKYITSNMTEFDQVWDDMTGNYLIPRASSSGSGEKKYAAGITDLTQLESIYALMECTPDISQSDCRLCLQQSVRAYRSCCRGKQGGAVKRPSCFFRWDLYPFSDAFHNVSRLSPPPPPPPSPSVPSPPPQSPANTTPRNKKHAIIGAIVIIVPLLLFLICIVRACIFVRARIRKVGGRVKLEDNYNEDCDITTMESLQFDFQTIETATQKFAPQNKVGEGGFGAVYKGILANGEPIAVKRLSRSSKQGAQEFKNEATLVAKLQHRNLVRLRGFCVEREEKVLVYEFVANKSLDYFLNDLEKRRQLDWPKRSSIIAGIARGMLYLHEDSPLRIIHRDLKASNVLLDENMAPKISDFGTARIFGADQTQTNTGRVIGTRGYMAPEYLLHGQISSKTDVYSFGVLLLEIITGKKNRSFHQVDTATNIVTYVWRHWRDGASMEVLDPTLLESCSMNEVNRCIHIGLLCVQEDPADRPAMATVALMLNSYSAALSLPQEPAYVLHTPSAFVEQDQSASKSVPVSVNEVSMTELYPR